MKARDRVELIADSAREWLVPGGLTQRRVLAWATYVRPIHQKFMCHQPDGRLATPARSSSCSQRVAYAEEQLERSASRGRPPTIATFPRSSPPAGLGPAE